MSPISRLTAAVALLLIGGGLTLRHCGEEPLARSGKASGKLSSRDRDAAPKEEPGEHRDSKAHAREVSAEALEKIKFDLDEIRPDGLRGPEDGLVSVSYEFCVPDDEATLAELRRIAPWVNIQAGSRGRSVTREGQALCIGSTHGPDWKQELMVLADLDYVVEIRECFFE